MPEFLTNLLNRLRGERGTDMRLLCRELLSQRGEASQTVLAQRIIEQYKKRDAAGKLAFFQMLATEFAADQNAIKRAIEGYEYSPEPEKIAALAAAAEAPRQE